MRIVVIHRLSCAVGSLVALVLATAPALASSAIHLNVPEPPKFAAYGLNLSVESDWVESPGYRPVKITVTCTPPALAARTLNVQLTTTSWYLRGKTSRVLADLEIPAGWGTANTIISMPQYFIPNTIALDVWEDGRKLGDLCVDQRGIASSGSQNWQDSPSILFVAPATVTLDLTNFGFLFDGTKYRPAQNAAIGLNSGALPPTFASVNVADLSDHWIDYSCLDVVVMSLSDLENLAASRPQAWTALRHWTKAGGNLCVHGVGTDWHGLLVLEKLLESQAKEAEADTPLGGWLEPDPKLLQQDQPAAAGSGVPFAVEMGIAVGAAKKPKSSQDVPFVSKDIMLGRVVAIAAANPFPGNKSDWHWLFDSLGPNRSKWRYRHGLSCDADNPSFDNLLIADVGLPPVKTYRVLITLFVIGIGPLNYWLLYRSGRLHLLLFTVPAAACLASAALLGYVFVGDGLSSWLRARSFTVLDQRSHQSAHWARLSYYTGLAPAGGPTFPGDTVVIPLEKTPSDPGWGSNRARSLVWSDQQQHLTRGWLAARTPTQFLTLRASPSQRQLTVRETANQACTVKNQLGTKIKRLLLCDTAGQLHFGKEIEPDGALTLQTIVEDDPSKEILTEMSGMLNHDGPMLPEQIYRGRTNSIFGGQPVINARRAWRPNSDPGDTSSSLLERRLAVVDAAIKAGQLEPRTYIALVERPKEIAIGIPIAQETQSLHVIFGTW